MVCVPCFIIPVLLYIWHRFIQPIMLRYWNPWANNDAKGNIIKETPAFPFDCKGGVCTFAMKPVTIEAAVDEHEAVEDELKTKAGRNDLAAEIFTVETDSKKDK